MKVSTFKTAFVGKAYTSAEPPKYNIPQYPKRIKMATNVLKLNCIQK